MQRGARLGTGFRRGAFGESALVFRKTFRTMWDKRIFKYNP